MKVKKEYDVEISLSKVIHGRDLRGKTVSITNVSFLDKDNSLVETTAECHNLIDVFPYECSPNIRGTLKFDKVIDLHYSIQCGLIKKVVFQCSLDKDEEGILYTIMPDLPCKSCEYIHFLTKSGGKEGIYYPIIKD